MFLADLPWIGKYKAKVAEGQTQGATFTIKEDISSPRFSDPLNNRTSLSATIY